VKSVHVYFKPFKMKRADRPVVLSEFGGYAYAATGKKYGYRFFEDREKYMEAVKALYENEVVPAISEGLCGAIYTQLSDIEEEQNGVITYDRSSFKADPEGMREIAESIAKEEKKL